MNAPRPLPVVLTRSRSDNARLASRLRAQGLTVLSWPALRTRLLPGPGRPALLATLRAADAVVFTSRRGLLATRALAGSALREALAPPRRVACVGRGTATIVRRLGVEPAFTGEAGAEALAATLAGALPAGSRVVLLRGAEADDVPLRSLQQAGLIVDDLRVYRQEPPDPPACAPRELGAVVCASPSAARRVLSWHPWAARAPFVAIGETTAAALRELGVAEIRIARATDNDSLCEAVRDVTRDPRHPMTRELSESAFRRACSVAPGGVHSPVRAFRSVGGTPVFFASASGSRVIDVDGNGYVDFCMSWGPLILGHAHPDVLEAVSHAAARGLSFGACHKGEAELCEAILAGFPEFHRVRLMSSGTEAVMTALRLTRGATGRPLVLKFEGGYHGHVDAMLVKAGSGLATLGTASSAGVPEAIAGTTLVVPFDDPEALSAAFAAHGPRIACAIVEPIPANDGLLLPRPGSLQHLRDLCDRHGSLLVFDEVISGFRYRYGGVAPLVGVRPDLVTLGKIVGGGMPVGAVTGPAHLLDRLAPLGPVYQAGTLSGNPVSCASGLATLARLRDGEAYSQLERLGARLEDGLRRAGLPWLRVVRMGSVAWPYLAEGEPPRRADRIAPETVTRFNAIHGRMLDRGFYLPPSAHEVLFLSTAHTEADVDGLCAALAEECAALPEMPAP